MNAFQNALRLALGIVIAGVSLVVFATLGPAFLGFALVLGVSTAIAMKLSGQKMAPARATACNRRGPHVWNDGRGKIIDL